MKIRLQIKDVNNTLFTRTRDFYQNDRSVTFEGAEVAHRKTEPEIELLFSGKY